MRVCLQVDVTLSGHDHKYERTCPVYKRNCLPYDANGTAGGPTHVVRSPLSHCIPSAARVQEPLTCKGRQETSIPIHMKVLLAWRVPLQESDE